jgi:hypothetical protein
MYDPSWTDIDSDDAAQALVGHFVEINIPAAPDCYEPTPHVCDGLAVRVLSYDARLKHIFFRRAIGPAGVIWTARPVRARVLTDAEVQELCRA